MGRKETSCLQNISCDSMEQQEMKVRPVLLNRKSLDSSDIVKNSHHRKNKSQQVRFKEDSTIADQAGFTDLEAKPTEKTILINGKAEKRPGRSMCLLSHPKSQRGLQNIAIQTSPSLRKQFPIFKTKKLTNKSLNEFPTDSSCFQINGDISEEDMALQLSNLRIAEHLEEGFKRDIRHCPLRHTIPKAQSNGPIHESSGLEFVDMLGKVTVSTQVPDVIESTFDETEESNFISITDQTLDVSLQFSKSSDLNCSQPSESQSSKQKDSKPQEGICQSKLTNNEELLTLKPSTDCKRIITLKPSLNSNLSYCFHSEHHQSDKKQSNPNLEFLHNVDQSVASSANDEGLQSETTLEKGPENKMGDSLQCSGGPQESSCQPQIEEQYETKKESKESHRAHKVHGGLCSLQGKLHSIEESLQSNQEKIKILLNVIQDLEKARALSEGRNFYRTGQDINNCSTCQSTACIIYSVEYDFRQQEGRFHQVLKMLDKEEQCPILPPVHKPEPENVIPEKTEVRKKCKKVKKKCFWWI
ncbi:protein INSYN2B [Bombina bombina]|uniref:protein INSYN2B n=1 Tax=Bombina bombina TaxID=8345 RepID=UPI00235B1D3B|nr:protein INSYN2B [Bombina bombina]